MVVSPDYRSFAKKSLKVIPLLGKTARGGFRMWRTFPLWVKSARFHVRFSVETAESAQWGFVPELQSICFRTEANPETELEYFDWRWWFEVRSRKRVMVTAFKTHDSYGNPRSPDHDRVEQQQPANVIDLVYSCCCSVARRRGRVCVWFSSLLALHGL